MKEFETPAISLNQGLRRFKSVRNSSQLEECFNLSPTENGLEVHEILTDLNADGVTWDGLGKLERPMEDDDITINVSTLIELEDVEGVTVSLDGTSEGTTDADGNITISDVTVGVHNVTLTKTDFVTGVTDDILNDYIIVEPKKDVTINIADIFTGDDISGVEVYLDGRKLGKTNSEGDIDTTVRPGVHKIRLFRPGWATEDGEDILDNDYITVT